MKGKIVLGYFLSAGMMVGVVAAAYFLPPAFAAQNSRGSLNVPVKVENDTVLGGYKYTIPAIEKLILFARGGNYDGQVVKMVNFRDPQGDEMSWEECVARIPGEVGRLKMLGVFPDIPFEDVLKKYLTLLPSTPRSTATTDKKSASEAQTPAEPQFVLYVDMANPSVQVTVWEWRAQRKEGYIYCAVDAETGKLLALEWSTGEALFDKTVGFDTEAALQAYFQYWNTACTNIEKYQNNSMNEYTIGSASENKRMRLMVQIMPQTFILQALWAEEEVNLQKS